jgi:alkaline phosphatase D
MKRRLFLADLTRYAALCAVVPNDWRVTRRPRLADDPFQLGVASGDPTSTGGVIWTRLAPRPLDPEGGMDGQRTVVNWEVAEDDAFARIVKRGRATAAPELSYSIHVDVDGLQPSHWYFYRFSTGGATGATSVVGRLRTTPPAGASDTPLRFAFASCQHYEQGLYTAYQHMVKEELDLVAHLGDYIYEYAGIDGRVRKHAGLECTTLDGYRLRYAQYKTDASLRAAHTLCPWVVTWDDHEVDNNYAGAEGENGMESEEQMHLRRAAAYQAWWEHQAASVPRARSWADLSITRTINWGDLARFWVLDTRQYRTPHGCHGTSGAHIAPCAELMDPARTMMGTNQERWITNGLGASRSRWQVIANQVMMAPWDNQPGPEVRVSLDTWSGYPAARDRLLSTIAQRAPNRTVVITGDIHSNWVSELRSSFSRPEAPTVAVEFVGTSISSGGDGADANRDATPAMLSELPYIKWHNARRGYVSCVVTPDEYRASYRVVPFVSKPDAPLETPTTWLVQRGRPGLQRIGSTM